MISHETITSNAHAADSPIRSYAPALLALIAALLLSLEFWLRKTGHGGLCPTAGCALVGAFVKYGEIAFIVLGMVFFWILAGLLFLGRRADKPWFWMTAAIILMAGLAFDGAILGFQSFGIREACILCFSVGASLFLILSAFGWMRRSPAVALLGAAVWAAAFVSQAFFVFPDKTPDLNETVLTTFRPAANQGEEIFLFFSLHCDRCTELMAALAANPPEKGNWHLVPLDTGPEDQRKLSALLGHPLAAINPFTAILALKNGPAPQADILPKAVDAPRKGTTFMRNSGYLNIPMMLVGETPRRRVVLEGPKAILEYLFERRLIASRASS